MTRNTRARGGRLALGGALLALGCAGGARPGPGELGPGEAPWVRRIAPFPVLGEGGVPYGHPFLGGFNQPRPQLVDVDGDGDDDLFVQEASGSVMFFERTDDPTLPYRWRTDRFADLEVGEWYRFVDMDRDGDVDLIAETPYSFVRYYRNDGTPTRPDFRLLTDTLRTADGEPVFSDRQNIPNATDLDCDGRTDLFIGRLTGTISHYEESGVDATGSPTFRLLSNRFQDIEIVAQIGSNRHGANTMELGDIDADGDEDLLWGDYFEPGILLIENRGSCGAPSLRGEPLSFPPDDPLRTSGYNAPTMGDVDGDGDADLLIGTLGGAFNPNTTTVDNFHLLEQVAGGAFVHRTSRFVSTLDVGAESVPVLVDLDGDGDLDLLVGNKIQQDDTQNGALYRFVNDGSPRAPSFRLDGTLDLGGGYHLVPAFGDLDGDGDLDVILGTWEDRLRLYLNDGPGVERLALADSAYLTLTRGRNATPALGDVDGDGDLDLVVGESSGTLNFYRNVGTPREADFRLESDELAGIDPGRRSFPVLIDRDGDGDLDLLVGTESAGIHAYLNVDGSGTFEPDGTLPLADFGFAAPAFGDLDGDGDDDLLLGGTGGGLWFYERRGG